MGAHQEDHGCPLPASFGDGVGQGGQVGMFEGDRLLTDLEADFKSPANLTLSPGGVQRSAVFHRRVRFGGNNQPRRAFSWV